MQSQRETDDAAAAVRPRIVIIGAGIAGLACAYKLTTETTTWAPAPEIILLEASSRAGGMITSYSLDEFVLELGPDSFITQKPAALELCKKLGLEKRLINTNPKHRRTFVALNDKLHALPESFFLIGPTRLAPLVSSALFSWQGKMRMATEPFIPPAPPDADESIADFVRRRFGQECFERAAQPLSSGIFTGDAERLSMRSALPNIWQLEQQYGSVMKGFWRENQVKPNESGARYGMFVTLDEGLGVLVNSLTTRLLPGCLRTNSAVSHVEKSRHGKTWQVMLHNRSAITADVVIVATSAAHASMMLRSVYSVSDKLGQIRHSSSSVINFVYRKDDVPHPLDGFGFVVPAIERANILACSFSSVKWPQRAPEDRVHLRIFVGGELDKEIFEYNDEQIECLIWRDLNKYLGIEALPILAVISRYPRSMPQYNVGHEQLVAGIEALLETTPGLYLAGNAYSGVGIPDCVSSGEQAAQRAITLLKSQQAETVREGEL